jgi:hypothetical protein
VELPKGWTEVEVKTSDYESFATWIEGYYGHKPVKYGQKPNLKTTHKYGYTILDKKGNVVKTVDRTNPNRKWDGYMVGGRCNGFFKLKEAALAAGAGTVGQPSWGMEPAPKGYADQAHKGEIDIEGMRLDAGNKAAAKYDRFHDILAKNPGYVPFKVILAKHEAALALPPEPESIDELDNEPESLADLREKALEAARSEYRSQPAQQAINADEEFRWMWDGYDEFFVTREECIQAARDRAFTTFALLKDGEWYEKGRMGWFALVSNEKVQGDWNKEFNSIIDGLSDDTLLTVCDCHI